MSNRCNGLCCKRFIIDHSPEEIAKSTDPDAPILIAMLIHHGTVTKNMVQPNGETAADDYPQLHIYSCKHLQINGNCEIYEKRPKMCADFPYGGICLFKNCEWSKVNHEAAKVRRQEVNDILKTIKYKTKSSQ